jgi:hypothetical protein
MHSTGSELKMFLIWTKDSAVLPLSFAAIYSASVLLKATVGWRCALHEIMELFIRKH